MGASGDRRVTSVTNVMVPSGGLEPPTPGLGNRCSVLLSYGAMLAEREGFEPSWHLTMPSGFQDRRIQPLCHLSE